MPVAAGRSRLDRLEALPAGPVGPERGERGVRHAEVAGVAGIAPAELRPSGARGRRTAARSGWTGPSSFETIAPRLGRPPCSLADRCR